MGRVTREHSAQLKPILFTNDYFSAIFHDSREITPGHVICVSAVSWLPLQRAFAYSKFAQFFPIFPDDENYVLVNNVFLRLLH